MLVDVLPSGKSEFLYLILCALIQLVVFTVCLIR